MRRQSSKQRAFEAEIDRLRPELMERAGDQCELMTPMVCVHYANLAIHHRRSRRIRKDGKANSLSNLMVVCLPCHALVHHDRKWAREHGFIISSNADPDVEHVNRAGVRWMP